MTELAPPSELTLFHPRLRAYSQLISTIRRNQAMGSGSMWLDFLDRLPVTLGESSADRVVRYSVSDRVYQAILRSVDGLVDLIKRRADPEYDREKKSALLPDERMRVVLWPQRFCPRTLPEESPLRSVVSLSLLESPDLDGGLMESWLSRAAGGMALVSLLRSLVTSAVNLAREDPSFSGVGLMCHLALLNTLLAAKERGVKAARVKNMSYGRLERAVGMALHAAFARAVRESLAGGPASPSTASNYADSVVMLSSLGPLAFFSIRKTELSADINPYGLSTEVVEQLIPVYQAALERGNDPLHLLRECLRAVYRQKSLLDFMTPQAVCEATRRLSLAHLIAEEDSGRDCDRLFAESFSSNKALAVLLDDASVVEDLIGELSHRIESGRQVGRMLPHTRRLKLALEQMRKSPSGWKTPTQKNSVYLQELVERFLLLRLDEFAQAQMEQARKRVQDRRLTSTTTELIQEYESGKLYRIADDELPLVKARVLREQAQLFVDLKGYTRRTARAKELVMADFLKKEFYDPIMTAARGYCSGGSLLPDEDNIRLVNLLGDAVAFSGNIVSLVGLAHAIQKIFRDYRHKLQEQSPMEEENAYVELRRKVERQRAGILAETEQLNRQLEPIKQEVFRRSSLDPAGMVQQLQTDFEEQFAKLQTQHLAIKEQMKSLSDPGEKERLSASASRVKAAHEQLKMQRQRTHKELKQLHGDELSRRLSDLLCQVQLKQVREIEEQIRKLQQEDRTLVDALEQERRLQVGSGLEAGLYISYGVTPELISIEDEIWGTQQVFISERINEAARGTARNPAIIQRLEDLLATARVERSNPGLDLPFRVYIDDTRSFGLDPSTSRLWSRALDERDRDQLDRFLSALQTQIIKQFEEISRARSESTSPVVCDIYNLGEAISAGALDAYLRQTRHTHFFFRIQVRSTELHPEFLVRFVFPEDMISLIVGRSLSNPDTEIEVFRYVGQVLFRGFEVNRPTPVYEILRPASPFVRLLDKHHMESWMEEAVRNPECKLEGLVSMTAASEPAGQPD